MEFLAGNRIIGTDSEKGNITFESDFSSASGWTTSNSSKVDISTSNNELQIKENGGSLAQMYYDLGASVSATKWVIRCRILVNGNANTDEVLFKLELNDTSNASSNTNSDALGFYVYTDRNNTWSRIYQVCKDNTTSVQGLSATPAYYGNISSGTYYYITLTRSSATDFEVKIRTGSHSGTVLGTLTQSSIPSGLTGLRYLTAQNYLQGQGQTMDISNLEFYNGVSSATPATWTNPVCASTISSTATMGSNGDFDVEYTTVASKTGSGQRGCNAWEFDGSSTSPYTGRNAVKGATNADFAVSSSTAFTIAAWVKLNTLGQQHTILGYSGHYTDTFWTNLGISAANKVEGHTATNGRSNNYIPTGNSLSVDTWHHCVFIHEADKTVTVYLDADTANKGTGTGDTGSASSGYWTIAGRWGQAVIIPTFPFLDGFIDQATLWDVALSEADVITLYNGGRLTPPSVSQNNIKGYWTFSETSGAAENKAV